MLINVKRLADPQYRRELIAAFLAKAAHTQPDALPYPQDWSEPAASPPAYQALAEATQAALSRRAALEAAGTQVSDCDHAVTGNATWWCRPDASNLPADIGAHWIGISHPHQPGFVRQVAWPFALPDTYADMIRTTWTRQSDGRGWSAWTAVAIAAPTGTPVTDWDQATLANMSYWSLPDAANRPSGVITAHWLGIVVVHNQDWLLQLCWPFAGGASGISSTMQWARVRTPNGWTNWARQANFVHSYGMVDGFIDYRHHDVTRFKAGLKYGGAAGEPSGQDQYRIQCYDPSGQYTFTAMTINQNGVVSFPKGHALTRHAREEGDPVPANQAATHGDVAAMLIIALRAYSAGQDPEPLIRSLIAGDDA